ncbi:MAG: hypothetical protein ACRDTC_26625 [Pseudonocardiaceae bacterium]
MPEPPISPRDRLLHGVSHFTGATVASATRLRTVLPADPELLREAITEQLGDTGTVVVTGMLDRRLILAKNDAREVGTAADLSGPPHGSRSWPGWTKDHLAVSEPRNWLSKAQITAEGLRRLLRPRMLLASLYHPKLPAPPFPAGDLRSGPSGAVHAESARGGRRQPDRP